MRVFVVFFAVATFGCADNAILELEITYPALPSDVPELYVVAQAQKASFGQVELRWMGVESSRSVQLGAAPQLQMPLSIVGEGEIPETGTEDLIIKFLFCTTPNCRSDDLEADPIFGEIWYRVESPFYLGDVTKLSLTLPGVPRCRQCTDDSMCMSAAICAEMPGTCSCEPAGMTEQLCYQDLPLMRRCVAEEPPTPRDKSTCEVALNMEAQAAWLCTVDKCDVQGCIEGSPTTYCEDRTNRVHECEVN